MVSKSELERLRRKVVRQFGPDDPLAQRIVVLIGKLETREPLTDDDLAALTELMSG